MGQLEKSAYAPLFIHAKLLQKSEQPAGSLLFAEEFCRIDMEGASHRTGDG